MAVTFAAWGNHQFVIPSTGAPASGYKLYTYVAGSSTPVTTYTTSLGNVQQSFPIVLNSAGFPTIGQLWLTEGTSIKVVFTDASDVVIKTEDNIPGISSASAQDQWLASGLTPTFVSTTSFTLAGDQTTAFHPGRRVKTTNSGGTVYSYIKTSVFGALTTVTVVNDGAGVLDSGLSAVSLGLLTTDDPSTPLLTDAYPIVSGSSDKTKKLRFEVDGLTTNTTRVITMPDADVFLALPGAVIQSVSTSYVTYSGNSAVIPYDNSIPAITEGTELVTASITPKSTANKIRVRFNGPFSGDATIFAIAALFRDAVSAALAAQQCYIASANAVQTLALTFEETAPSTSAITYRIRVGPSANTLYWNGDSSARLFGGVSTITLIVEEIKG